MLPEICLHNRPENRLPLESWHHQNHSTQSRVLQQERLDPLPTEEIAALDYVHKILKNVLTLIQRMLIHIFISSTVRKVLVKQALTFFCVSYMQNKLHFKNKT